MTAVTLESQLHPYLKERLRDFKKHKFCVIEQQLVMEDETIWGGYNADHFNELIMKACEPDLPLITENASGDMICRKPRNQQDRLQAMNDALGDKELSEEDFHEEGSIGMGKPHGKTKVDFIVVPL